MTSGGIEPITPESPSDVSVTSPKSHLERLVDSLLFEGYALYPYTPESRKNATPTPFGIVYPPGYARLHPHTFDHLQIESVVVGPPTATVEAEVRYLTSSGARHQAAERRVATAPHALETLAREASTTPIEGGTPGEPGGVLRLEAELLGDDLWRVRARVENRATPPGDMGAFERPQALVHAFLSTHVVLRAAGARFVSPLEREGQAGAAAAAARHVNTWPVLATPADDALLGAAIVLPDHPEIAPESRGSLFDNTEIEEALLLHVHALSEGEREAIAAQDSPVRDLIRRALEATPADILRLHGVMREARPSAAAVADGEPGENFRYLTRPRDERPLGESEVVTARGVLRPGQHVRLRLGGAAGAHDPMYDGRAATIQRIVVDDGGRPHLGVTLDDDPGRDVLRDSGRFLYFFPDEIEVIP